MLTKKRIWEITESLNDNSESITLKEDAYVVIDADLFDKAIDELREIKIKRE